MADQGNDSVPLYTRQDVERLLRESHGGTMPPRPVETTVIPNGLEQQVIRVAVLAAQAAIRERDGVSKHFDDDKPAVFTRAECQQMVREMSAKLMGDIGLPIDTDEKRRQTVLRVESVLKLESNTRRFFIIALGGAGSIVMAALAAFFTFVVPRLFGH